MSTPHHRINVIGASGCGASTAGRAIADALGVPYFDSDDYFHAPSDPPFTRPRNAEERCEMVTEDLRTDASWVLGGGVVGWTPYPELEFTTVVFLWIPTDVRVERLRRRERERHGDRVLPGGDMHAMHLDFIEWASRYDPGDVEGKTLARHEQFLAEQTCPVVEIRGVETTDEIVRRVLERSEIDE